MILRDLYERCAVQHGTKRKREPKDHFRRQPSEYFFTYDIDCILELLQNTRADKVRELRKEAMEISEKDNKTLEQVLEENSTLDYNEDEFWENSPVRFEIRTTRCSQNPSRVKHLHVIYKQELHIRITHVPQNAEDLYDMCKLVNVAYRGENIASVAESIVIHSWTKPRHNFTDAEKGDIRKRQHNCCPVCKEELGEDAELDHIVCLANWGQDDVSNVEFKCANCHLEKTEQERLSGYLRYNPLASTMNRDALEQFVMAPKPPQIVAGKVKEDDVGLDVRQCRTSALLNNQLSLPRFNLLDTPEP